VLEIKRQPFRDDKGTPSSYPWYLSITNGEAPVKEGANGTNSFDGSKMRNKKVAHINLSDRDMFRMMLRTVRFTEVWENATCIPVVLAAKARREAQREEVQG
jgi:hypothetical protein